MTIDVVFLTNDLMFSSRVMSLAKSAGVSLKVVGSRRAVAEQVAEFSPAIVFVDLEHAEAQMAELVRELGTKGKQEKTPKIVAYGPHVKQTLLDAALAAGSDTVLSRGQFDKQAAAILQDLATQKNSEAKQGLP